MAISTVDDLVKHHEGCVLTAKPDAKGKWEIGWGRDISPSPGVTCTQEQADEWFATDLALAKLRAKSVIGGDVWYRIDLVRQAVLTDMAYELGGEGLGKFARMLNAIRAADWNTAHREALNSAWAKQVPFRAAEDAVMLLTGEWPK